MPDVTIVMTTWLPPDEEQRRKRAHAETIALLSWKANLRYSGGRIRLHIADDGSQPTPDGYDPASLIAYHWGEPTAMGTTRSRQERHGVGASLNAGCSLAFERGDIVLHAVDDWMLTEPFDITPWVDLLAHDESICAVRMFPHPDLTGRVLHLGDLGHALLLDRHHFAFATRPALYHQRMFDAYGRFDEDVSAYTCEQLYNERFCARTDGPDIVLALPSPWRPLESIELAGIEPGA